ncbi:MAG: branched-chain amino acid ABC transporter permease [Desulfomonile tiedjei]|uniref:Branched-chain amino acid ABC transporter permease n=1 Tax=Desulfomonile tiedjei TaxID=2358 RepID=A0A9D6V8A3_9BACT|nr:branched-chain amino acid ABC transporter permease [Desulfomonile tiedjei]
MDATGKSKWIVGLAAAVLLIAFPLIIERLTSQYYLYLTVKIMIWALFATSFNLVLGYGGMMSFGHAAFYGAGAYCCALLLVKTACPVWAAALAGPAFAAAIGLVIGYFSVKIKGVFYFATLTLAFSQLFYILVFKWRSLTLGDDGIQGIPVPECISTLESYTNYYYFALVVTAICFYILRRIVQSPFGLILNTLRENAERSTFIGVNAQKHRLIAFVISAFFSGIAGVLLVFLETSLSPDVLKWSNSGEVILMGLLGGMHVFLGPTLGAAIMVLLNSFVTSYSEYWGLCLGLTLVLIVLFFPQGVGGLVHERLEARAKRKTA